MLHSESHFQTKSLCLSYSKSFSFGQSLLSSTSLLLFLSPPLLLLHLLLHPVTPFCAKLSFPSYLHPVSPRNISYCPPFVVALLSIYCSRSLLSLLPYLILSYLMFIIIIIIFHDCSLSPRVSLKRIISCDNTEIVVLGFARVVERDVCFHPEGTQHPGISNGSNLDSPLFLRLNWDQFLGVNLP